MRRRKSPVYEARPEYLEECTFMVIVEMLERLPCLKMRIKKYLKAFSGWWKRIV